MSAKIRLYAPPILLGFQDQLPVIPGAATFAEMNVRFSFFSLGFRTDSPEKPVFFVFGEEFLHFCRVGQK